MSQAVRELDNDMEEGHPVRISPLIHHTGRGVPHWVGGRDTLWGDLGQRLLCCGVCRFEYLRGKASGVPVIEGITFGLLYLGNVVAYHRHKTWKGGWCRQGGSHDNIMKADLLIIAAWLCQRSVGYEIFNSHRVASPLKH